VKNGWKRRNKDSQKKQAGNKQKDIEARQQAKGASNTQSEQRKRRTGFKLSHAEEQQCREEPAKKEENSETAEAGTTRNKRTLEGVEGENGGTEKGLKEDKGRKGKRRGGGVPFLHLWTLWRREEGAPSYTQVPNQRTDIIG